MKGYVVEFGNRGGVHVDNHVVSSKAQAESLARRLVAVFENDPHAKGATRTDWVMERGIVRATWRSKTHFVAVSKLDGVLRGAASAGLWRDGASLFEGTVLYYGARDC